MKAVKTIILIILSCLMLGGCGGGGGGTSPAQSPTPTPTPTPRTTASINTQITGSNAVSTVSINGAPSPSIIYGFQLTINFPTGATFNSATAIGVNQGVNGPNFVVPNAGPGSALIVSAVSLGNLAIGSGDVLSVNFTNVPNSAQATDFTVTNFVAKDGNGVLIQ